MPRPLFFSVLLLLFNMSLPIFVNGLLEQHERWLVDYRAPLYIIARIHSGHNKSWLC